MALLGWVPGGGLQDVQQPRFAHNASGRFECRWITVAIQPSPSVLLKVRARERGPCRWTLARA
jgi:phosphoribosylformylglycinamidine synthase